MSPRLEEALLTAVNLCGKEAVRLRSELSEEDGAPDAPPRRTHDGLWESDAAEYDEDARLIRELIETMRAADERAPS